MIRGTIAVFRLISKWQLLDINKLFRVQVLFEGQHQLQLLYPFFLALLREEPVPKLLCNEASTYTPQFYCHLGRRCQTFFSIS